MQLSISIADLRLCRVRVCRVRCQVGGAHGGLIGTNPQILYVLQCFRQIQPRCNGLVYKEYSVPL
jgi:hypothetical protein